MTCEKAFNKYLSLDKNERVPLWVTAHLFACPACRMAVRYMTRAEVILAQPLASRPHALLDNPVFAKALARITDAGLSYPSIAPEEGNVFLFRWLISGLALIAGFAILPFSSLGAWSRLVFGNAFSVPFYILSGVAITAYCGMFVGTNIDFFVKKFGIAPTA